MKLNEMTIVITGANGVVASELMDYFSNKAAYVVGTVRQLSEKFEKNENTTIIEMDPLDHYSIDKAIGWVENEAGHIHVWLNIIGGFTMGNRVEEGDDDWNYMYNTNFMTTLNCCQKILKYLFFPPSLNGFKPSLLNGKIVRLPSKVSNKLRMF